MQCRLQEHLLHAGGTGDGAGDKGCGMRMQKEDGSVPQGRYGMRHVGPGTSMEFAVN